LKPLGCQGCDQNAAVDDVSQTQTESTKKTSPKRASHAVSRRRPPLFPKPFRPRIRHPLRARKRHLAPVRLVRDHGKHVAPLHEEVDVVAVGGDGEAVLVGAALHAGEALGDDGAEIATDGRVLREHDAIGGARHLGVDERHCLRCCEVRVWVIFVVGEGVGGGIERCALAAGSIEERQRACWRVLAASVAPYARNPCALPELAEAPPMAEEKHVIVALLSRLRGRRLTREKNELGDQ